jgi:hypothetical protein
MRFAFTRLMFFSAYIGISTFLERMAMSEFPKYKIH